MKFSHTDQQQGARQAAAVLFGKKVEKLLAKLFPGRFVPLYYMVTFSRTPYADAVARARAQWRTVIAAAGLALLTILSVLAGVLAWR